MLFYLTSLHVSYVLTDFEPTDLYLVDGENVPTEAQVANYEKMNAAKPVVKQLEELQIIVHEIEVEGMDMSFEQLVLKIRVEEDNRMNEKDDANSIEPNTNMVRESSSKSNGKPRHGVKDCRRNKEHGDGNFVGNSNQANHVESLKEFAGVIESFLNTNVVDWWFDIGALHSLWGEACLTANTILNKIPHKKSDKSPYQLWKGKQPSYKRMKVWVCLVNVQIHLPMRTKLGPKTVDCVYLGLTKNSVAYRFLVNKSNVEDINNNTIIESVEAEFFENTFPYKDKDKQISNPRKRVLDD
ncbi:DNA polymerase zeta catalytic subunit-like protein [Tanacetum coccineum]